MFLGTMARSMARFALLVILLSGGMGAIESQPEFMQRLTLAPFPGLHESRRLSRCCPRVDLGRTGVDGGAGGVVLRGKPSAVPPLHGPGEVGVRPDPCQGLDMQPFATAYAAIGRSSRTVGEVQYPRKAREKTADAFLHEDIAARHGLQIVLRLALPSAKADAEQCFRKISGAAEGTRTPDPIITNDVLYQLSYSGPGAERS